MKSFIWGTMAVLIWIVGCWCAYLSIRIYDDNLLAVLFIFSSLLLSIIPVGMYLHNSDIGVIDDLKKENEKLKKKLKDK